MRCGDSPRPHSPRPAFRSTPRPPMRASAATGASRPRDAQLHRHGCAAATRKNVAPVARRRRASAPRGPARAGGPRRRSRAGLRADGGPRHAHVSRRARTMRRVDALYADALDALLRMQTTVDAAGLPAFDETFMTTEMELMPEWFLRRHLGHAVDCDEWDVIELAFRTLINALRRATARRSCIATTTAAICSSSATIPTQPQATRWRARHHRFPGRDDRSDHLRSRFAAARLLHRVGCRARRRLGRRLSRAPAPRAPDRLARRRRALPPLVRSRRAAAAHQGARHLLPPLLSRRQGALPRRPAADLAIT